MILTIMGICAIVSGISAIIVDYKIAKQDDKPAEEPKPYE